MNEFECYNLYTALKLHFTTDYDYFKYGGKCNVTPASFNKRRERFFFKKLAREYPDPELRDFLVSNFLNDINIEYIAQRTKQGVEINKMANANVLYLDEDNLERLDVSSHVKKKRMCNIVTHLIYIKYK